jgi:hypothetical protein
MKTFIGIVFGAHGVKAQDFFLKIEKWENTISLVAVE